MPDIPAGASDDATDATTDDATDDAVEARLVLVSRAGCHLCEDGQAVVAGVAARTGVGWRVVDVDADPELRRRFTDMVPVVLLDGAVHDFGRLDAGRLEQALAGRRWWRRNRSAPTPR